MVAVGVISSTAFLAVDQTCRRLDIMLLEVEIALEVKVACREEDVDNQDGRHYEANTCCFGLLFLGSKCTSETVTL
jgi:hypothetical protein